MLDCKHYVQDAAAEGAGFHPGEEISQWAFMVLSPPVTIIRFIDRGNWVQGPRRGELTQVVARTRFLFVLLKKAIFHSGLANQVRQQSGVKALVGSSDNLITQLLPAMSLTSVFITYDAHTLYDAVIGTVRREHHNIQLSMDGVSIKNLAGVRRDRQRQVIYGPQVRLLDVTDNAPRCNQRSVETSNLMSSREGLVPSTVWRLKCDTSPALFVHPVGGVQDVQPQPQVVVHRDRSSRQRMNANFYSYCLTRGIVQEYMLPPWLHAAWTAVPPDEW
ncbi:hypothetical protein SeLEV6574_g07299 [Synchytrium endobioticum]|uniref:Uncharacterized protein n=1 Tax=Synchytrium endobioticum TaxID=286115 RepID=A0A507CLY2_9FUNG|nr:hypothetical protein SeLEV6574_g07299 [Synchytrium endobioticum]